MMCDGNQSATTSAEAELAALLAALEAERPAFEAWLAEYSASAARELDALLADLAASGPDLAALLAALEADMDTLRHQKGEHEPSSYTKRRR